MPPRGRPKKVGLRRIDAAIDALGQLGFAKELVSKTIKKLLKVYGGDAGWPFIEEDRYSLVIDTILEEKNEEDMEEEGEAMDESRALQISEPIVEAGETGIHIETIADKPHSDISSADHMLMHDQQVQCMYALPSGEVERESDTRLDVGLSHMQQPNESPRVYTLPSGEVETESNTILDVGPSHMQQPNESPRGRRPCYGWISESDDDEDQSDDDEDPSDWVHVDQMQQMVGSAGGLHMEGNRPSRWGVRPLNM